MNSHIMPHWIYSFIEFKLFKYSAEPYKRWLHGIQYVELACLSVQEYFEQQSAAGKGTLTTDKVR